MILDHHNDRLSISSYGSHMNRTFNVGSHKGSLHSIDGPNHFDLLHLTPANAMTDSAFGGRRSVNIDDDAKSFDGADGGGDLKERIFKSCYDALRTLISMQVEQSICRGRTWFYRLLLVDGRGCQWLCRRWERRHRQRGAEASDGRGAG